MVVGSRPQSVAGHSGAPGYFLRLPGGFGCIRALLDSGCRIRLELQTGRGHGQPATVAAHMVAGSPRPPVTDPDHPTQAIKGLRPSEFFLPPDVDTDLLPDPLVLQLFDSSPSTNITGFGPAQSDRAFCAFLMFSRRARFCAGVGFSLSGTFGRGRAANRSPSTRRGRAPSFFSSASASP